MGLLGDLLNSAMSGGGGANAGAPATGGLHAGLLEHFLGMIQTGGLNGIIEKLKAGGLGPAVQSWTGSGPNQPVNGSQVASALGSSEISQLAAKFGIPPDQVASHLSQIMHEVINHLTPNGSVPSQSALSEGISLLRGKLFA
jgi:uncharacterized protein YidB (DUF937 family)